LGPGLQSKTDPHRHWKHTARLLAVLGVVYLAGSQFHPGEIERAFARLTPLTLIAVVLLLSPLAVLLRVLRWRRLLPGGKRLPLRSWIGAYLVGVMANSLLLGKFGDLAKARAICDAELDYGQSLAVVAIDRLLEGMALLLAFTVVLLTSPLPGWAYRLAWIAGLASVGVLVALWGLFHHRTSILEGTERRLGWLPASLHRRVLGGAQRLLAGCEALADYRRVLIALLYSLGVWAVEIATVATFLAAFSAPCPRLAAAVMILIVLNFGLLVPVSPGSVGVYQLLCVFALSFWRVDPQLAFGLGVVMQIVLFVPLYLAGFVWLLVLIRSRGKNVTAQVLPS